MGKILTLFISVVVFLAVASCGGNGDDSDARYSEADEVCAKTQEPEMEADKHTEELLDHEEPELIDQLMELWGRLVRGEWCGNVWTNEYLGLYFYLPEGWEHASDEEIADMLGIGAAIGFGGAGMVAADGFWETVDAVLYGMVAVDLQSGSNITVLIEWMPGPDFWGLLPRFGLGGALGGEPKQIGGFGWESFEAYMETFGIRQNLSCFVRVVDGFVVIILITTLNEFGADIEDYLSHFGYVGDAPEPSWEPYGTFLRGLTMDDYRLPALGQPDAGHPLVGTWAWDLNSGFVYNFKADGTGTRGFPWEIESFIWESSDNHLVIRLLLEDESWTFIIDNDVLTIDSRQFPGLVWRYVRQR